MPDLTPLAPIMAFEHHRKYDGTGYPEIRINGNRQHIFSQIIAIADCFDALRSKRPYRGSVEIEEIIVLLRKGAGKDFNPFLLDNFFSSLKTALN